MSHVTWASTSSCVRAGSLVCEALIEYMLEIATEVEHELTRNVSGCGQPVSDATMSPCSPALTRAVSFRRLFCGLQARAHAALRPVATREAKP